MRARISAAASLRAYIGTPPGASRHTRPMPCAVLRDGAIGFRPGVVEQRGVDVGQAAVGVDVGARKTRLDQRCAGGRREAPQPRHVRVLRLAHQCARRRMIEVIGIPFAGVRRIEHQRNGGAVGSWRSNTAAGDACSRDARGLIDLCRRCGGAGGITLRSGSRQTAVPRRSRSAAAPPRGSDPSRADSAGGSGSLAAGRAATESRP